MSLFTLAFISIVINVVLIIVCIFFWDRYKEQRTLINHLLQEREWDNTNPQEDNILLFNLF